MKRKTLVLDLDETLIHSHHDGYEMPLFNILNCIMNCSSVVSNSVAVYKNVFSNYSVYTLLRYTMQVNITFCMHWLDSLEVKTKYYSPPSSCWKNIAQIANNYLPCGFVPCHQGKRINFELGSVVQYKIMVKVVNNYLPCSFAA